MWENRTICPFSRFRLCPCEFFRVQFLAGPRCPHRPVYYPVHLVHPVSSIPNQNSLTCFRLVQVCFTLFSNVMSKNLVTHRPPTCPGAQNLLPSSTHQ